MFIYVFDLEFTVQYIHQQSANPLKLYSPHLCSVLRLPISLYQSSYIITIYHTFSHFRPFSFAFSLSVSYSLHIVHFCLNFFMAGFLINWIRAYQEWKRENGEYSLQIIEHTHACALACSCDLYLINRCPYVLTQTWTYFLLIPKDYLFYEKVSVFQKRNRHMYIHIRISFCVHACKTFFSNNHIGKYIECELERNQKRILSKTLQKYNFICNTYTKILHLCPNIRCNIYTSRTYINTNLFM